MKIVITGAGGFLGEHIIRQCLKQDSKIEILAITSKMKSLSQKYYDYIEVIDRKQLDKIVWNEIDILLNCAFPRNNDGEQMAYGLSFISDTITRATVGGVGAVINISSQSVYSQTRMLPATEVTSLNLETKYAVGKYATELLVNKICRNIPHTNLRMASLIGEGFEQRITNKLVAKAILGGDLDIIGGEQRFGFLNVEDAANGIVAVINSRPIEWKEVYNLGTNESHTLSEIAEIVSTIGERYLCRRISINYQGVSEWKNSSMSCDLFFKSFSWKPQYSMNDTINMLFKYSIKRTSIDN